MIVITDGESQDQGLLPTAVREADAKKIVRFSIGVSCTRINSILYHDPSFQSCENLLLDWSEKTVKSTASEE